MIRKSYAALRNLRTSLPNPNPMLSGQVKSEKTGSDPHHWTIAVASPWIWIFSGLIHIMPVEELYGYVSLLDCADKDFVTDFLYLIGD